MQKNSCSCFQFLNSLKVFFSPRMLVIFLLGFSSGLPLILSGSTLAINVKDSGGSLEAIGLYALVGLPYTLKFTWAPFLDAWRFPFLSKWFGHRRSWLLFSQILLFFTILALGSLNPLLSPFLLGLAAFAVAFSSATQDILIDAFRVEYLKNNEQATGTAYYVLAYRIGLLVGGAALILLVASLKDIGISSTDAWFYGYVAAACLMFIGIGTTLATREPTESLSRKKRNDDTDGATRYRDTGTPFSRLYYSVTNSFRDFLLRPDAIFVLLFIVFYKFCDTFAGIMIGPFLLDIGFSLKSYASIVKGIGFFASILGGFAGGFIARNQPIGRSLLIAGILQMISNLGLIWQAWIGVSALSLSIVISIENFTGAAGTVIFVAYIAALCNNPLYTATHFALLTSLSSIGRVFLPSLSGFVAVAMGWIPFFFLSIFMALPSLAIFLQLQRRQHFAKLECEQDKYEQKIKTGED